MPTQSTLWRSGQDGYHTYRIPALVVTTAGAVLAFCEGRRDSRHDHGDIDLLVRRSEDNGESWSSRAWSWLALERRPATRPRSSTAPTVASGCRSFATIPWAQSSESCVESPGGAPT